MTLDTGYFELARELALSPERLWDVLTDPGHRENWGAPQAGMVLTVETSDLREGGTTGTAAVPLMRPTSWLTRVGTG